MNKYSRVFGCHCTTNTYTVTHPKGNITANTNTPDLCSLDFLPLRKVGWCSTTIQHDNSPAMKPFSITMCRTWRPFSDVLSPRPIKYLPPNPKSVYEHTDNVSTLSSQSTLPPQGMMILATLNKWRKLTQLSGFQDFNTRFLEYYTNEGCKQQKYSTSSNDSDNDYMPDIQDMMNIFTEDEEDNPGMIMITHEYKLSKRQYNLQIKIYLIWKHQRAQGSTNDHVL
jgi:hypothetical protein